MKLVLPGLLLIAACGGGSSALEGASNTPVIKVDAVDIMFTPDTTEVDAGPVIIEYTNRDGVPHNLQVEGPNLNVVASSGSPSDDPEMVRMVFDASKTGDYTMVCVIHPTIRGTITSRVTT